MGKLKNLLKKIISKLTLDENILYYVSGSEGLPHPLSAENEEITIKAIATGCKEAKSRLIEHNIRLVVYIARRFENTGVDLDDLISVGTIGLIKAVNSFDMEKKIKFATYASRCIENEILMHLRRIVKIRSEVYLDEPLNVDFEGNELLLGDILGSDTDAVYKDIESGVERDLLWEALSKLSKREQEIMSLRFGLKTHNEKTQKEVADMLGISQSYISRLEKKIIFRLRREISKLV